MEERLNRRSRPRPYDLRRKVLLKNFFREQMSYVPTSREASSSDSSGDTSFIEESSSSVAESENTSSESDENDSSDVPKENIVPTSSEDFEPSIFNDSSSESNQTFKTNNVSKSILSNFSRLSNFMRLRSMSGATKSKGILKAKHVCKNKRSGKSSRRTKHFDTLFNRRDFKNKKNPEGSSSAASSKSIFSLFRSHRRKDRKTSDLSNNNNAACSSTSNQSVQTDMSWSVDEISNVEETNRMLIEENMLLSQSLSILMSTTSQTNNTNQDSSLHLPPHQDEMVKVFAPYDHNSPCYSNEASTSTVKEDIAIHKSQSRVLRSKSVHEQPVRKSSRCHRTKSLNYPGSSSHTNRRISSFDSTLNLQTMSPPDVDYRKLRFPRWRPPVLQTFPENGPRRTIRRRPSMPERTNSENVRPVCRRSESMQSYDRKRPSIPFHALPAQAFY